LAAPLTVFWLLAPPILGYGIPKNIALEQAGRQAWITGLQWCSCSQPE
jgi:hypothetical protein